MFWLKQNFMFMEKSDVKLSGPLFEVTFVMLNFIVPGLSIPMFTHIS